MTRSQLKRRTTKTLVRWLYKLSRLEWPRRIPVSERPQRNQLVRDIEHVLAWRYAAKVDAENREMR